MSGPAAIRRSGGFTLLELLVVLAVLALMVGLVVPALPDGGRQSLEREATRLAALLDAGRMESRASGIALYWMPVAPTSASPAGFRFSEQAGAAGPRAASRDAGSWLSTSTQADVLGSRVVVLGPDPVLPPQRIRLRQGEREVLLASDGVGSFRVVDPDRGRP